jgi:hypothetical protein
MIVSLLVSLIGTITFENPGVRLELCLQEMSKQAGQSLRCPVSLKDEVLAASFQNQSIDIVNLPRSFMEPGPRKTTDGG